MKWWISLIGLLIGLLYLYIKIELDYIGVVCP